MLTLTDQNFEEVIKKSDKPVLVDFWASWCNPCHVLSSILEKLAEEFKEKIIFAEANIDAVPITAQKFGIDRIPTVLLFKGGKPVSGFFGVRPESVICQWLEENLKNETERIEELIKEYGEYSEKNGFKLNPNREVVERLIKGMLENEKKYGKRYCCCRRITGNPEEDEKNVCPCIYACKEVAEQGHCLCGLFVKE